MQIKRILVACLCLSGLFAIYTNANAQELKNETAWKTHIELSFLNTSGNTDTQTLAVKLEFNKEGMINRYILKGNALYIEEKDEETANKWALDGRWERVFADRFFGFLSAIYLDDKFSGYDYRIAGGPGLGYDMVKTEDHHLKSLISLLYYYDEFIEAGKSADSYTAGKVEINYLWLIFKDLRLKENADYSVSFEESDKYFINSETALEAKLNTHISLGVSYRIAYQNLLPSSDIKHRDTTFLVSLIIDF